MLKGYFDSYTYNSPVKRDKSLWDKIIHCNRLYFTVKYAGVVFRTRKEAIRGIMIQKPGQIHRYIFSGLSKKPEVFTGFQEWRILQEILLLLYSSVII